MGYYSFRWNGNNTLRACIVEYRDLMADEWPVPRDTGGLVVVSSGMCYIQGNAPFAGSWGLCGGCSDESSDH